MIKSLLAATIVAAALASTPALAQDTRSVTVTSADLNLASPAGRAALDRRIRQAAKSVCALNTPGWLQGTIDERRCETSAREMAADRVVAIESASTRVASR